MKELRNEAGTKSKGLALPMASEFLIRLISSFERTLFALPALSRLCFSFPCCFRPLPAGTNLKSPNLSRLLIPHSEKCRLVRPIFGQRPPRRRHQ